MNVMQSQRAAHRSNLLRASGLGDPTTVAALVLAPLIIVGRHAGVVANHPLWWLTAVIVGAGIVKTIGTTILPTDVTGWRLWLRTGCQLVPAAFVMYTFGLGPTLAICLVFGVTEALRDSGAKATTPALVWTVGALALGQLAVAAGALPSLIDEQPIVQGLGVLAALGAVLTILALGRATRRSEVARSQLREREEHFRALVQNAADIILVGNPEDGSITYASPAFESALGYSMPEALEMSAYSLLHDDDVDNVHALFEPPFQASQHRVEVRLQRRDGAWRWFDVTMTDLTGNPAVGAWVANLHDITDRKLSEAALVEVQEAFRHAFEDAPIGIVLTDVEGSVLRANRSFTRLFRMDDDETVDVSMMMLTHPADRLTRQLQHEQLVRGDVDQSRLEARCVRSDGTTLWVSSNTSVVRDSEGLPVYLIVQVEDITERRALSDRLAYEASHDAITGLANRPTFIDELSRRLSADTAGGRRVGVLFIDLDHFNVVNDSLGRAASDDLLTTVAHRLRSVLRSRDVVARFGADEFVVLCGELTGAQAAVDVAERIASSLSARLQLGDGEVFLTASIGIALSEPGDTADMLMRHADSAMHRAQKEGRARIEIFDRRDGVSGVVVVENGTDLHRAVERREFVLHYQPIIELQHGTPIGAEALVRWAHPTRGLLLPGDFLNLAEETGLIVPIGEWVLRTACAQAAIWRAASRDATDNFFVSVNLSPRQLVEPTLGKMVRRILHETGCNPMLLRLDVTERSLMYDSDAAMRALDTFEQLGIRVSVDDFGAGFTSLTHLKRVPVDTLKIDRTLVSGVTDNAEQRQIVEAIVALAHALGLRTLAEGVERDDDMECLRGIGCDYAQGYLFGRPEAHVEQKTRPQVRN
jgi:diguanylate cyclase (GGDEF)-like protein/PAS domain S-box-containing protein